MIQIYLNNDLQVGSDMSFSFFVVGLVHWNLATRCFEARFWIEPCTSKLVSQRLISQGFLESVCFLFHRESKKIIVGNLET